MYYDQYHNGVKIYGSEIILYVINNEIKLMNGQYVFNKLLPESNATSLSKADAKQLVKKSLDNYHENWNKLKGLELEFNIERWTNDLVYYKYEDEYYLSYHITVYPNLGEHYEYFVNALDGSVINHYSTICRAHNHHSHDKNKATPPDGPAVATASDLFGTNRVLNTYEWNNNFFLIDGSRTMFSSSQSMLPDDPIGAIWTIDLNNTSPINNDAIYSHIVSTNNTWGTSPEGVSAHYNGGIAYDYFKETFGRESITGTGQNIISFINVADEDGSSLGNAFWNGVGIYCGNGSEEFNSLGRALDIAGHEMSHGVIQSSANLEYYGDSGAMNESFADIFGAMIDREDWLLGEDVVKVDFFPSGAIRNMADPHNGAQTGDFAKGWQPKHIDEKYTGTDDNGGVHINSGIANHAYFLFASQIGRDRAEQIFYRALTTYLTRSSGFKELRFAVVKSAEDLYGQTEINSARQAFDQVGIIDESQTDFEEEIETNPGADLLLVSDQDKSNLLIFDLATGQAVFDPITDIDQLSKPSVTDDGSRIVFVGTDGHIYLIDIDWNSSPPTSFISQVSYYPEWRNTVISKDGNRVALVDDSYNNEIIIIDIPSNTENTYVLTNPTYSDGVETGDVLYADAMEFDITSNTLMYDAINQVQSNNSGTLEFWDIAFLEVWNPAADTWALGRIDKLFGALPEGVSVGNPTFSKNSPFIIAMDFLDDLDISILGVNIENGDVGELFPNTTIGYPNYSRNDNFLIYDLDFFGNVDLGVLETNPDKITRVNNSDDILGPNLRWGIWFSNGTRELDTGTEEIIENTGILRLIPNPAVDLIEMNVNHSQLNGVVILEISDILGNKIYSESIPSKNLLKHQVDISSFDSATYILSLRTKDHIISEKFIKE